MAGQWFYTVTSQLRVEQSRILKSLMQGRVGRRGGWLVGLNIADVEATFKGPKNYDYLFINI